MKVINYYTRKIFNIKSENIIFMPISSIALSYEDVIKHFIDDSKHTLAPSLYLF